MKSLVYLIILVGLTSTGCSKINETMDALAFNRQAIEWSTEAINENAQAIQQANRSIEENKRQLDAINQSLKKVAAESAS